MKKQLARKNLTVKKERNQKKKVKSQRMSLQRSRLSNCYKKLKRMKKLR